MYEYLSEIKKRLWSKAVVLKTIFPWRLLSSIAGNSFFQSTMFLCWFSCGHLFFNGYGVFWKSTCSHELPLYNVFDRYFCLKRIAISKDHLKFYIWVVVRLFQETFAVSSYFQGCCVSLKEALAVISFFEVIKLIFNSSFSHPFGE